MYITEMKSTVNVKTNVVYYYQLICGAWQRISAKRFEYIKLMCDRMDCFVTQTTKMHVRHSASYYFEYPPF